MTLPSAVSGPANFTTMAVGGDQNLTHKPVCYLAETPELILTLVSVYVWLIAVLGILFNVFVLMVFCVHKKACTVAEIYLSNLAAADLVLMCCLPFWAVNIAKNYDWPFGRILCKVVNLGLKMNFYCSIYFLVLVSIDRYLALVHPLSQERFRRPKYAKLGCVLVWGFGLILSIPVLIYRDVKNCNGTTSCYYTYTATQHYVFESIQTIFSFIIPIFIISLCTVIIILTLKKRLTESQNRRRTDHKATTLLMVVLVAFLICWVPHQLFRIVDMLNRAKVMHVNPEIIESIGQIVIYFAFFNSVLNPILYVLVGKHFRKKVLEVFLQFSGGVTTLSTTSTRSNLLKSARSENV